MSVELAISIISVCIALIVAVAGLLRNSHNDTKEDSTQMTTVIVKLENINDGVREIKSDIKAVKDEVESIKERVVIVEQSTKSAHKRIDTLETNEHTARSIERRNQNED